MFPDSSVAVLIPLCLSDNSVLSTGLGKATKVRVLLLVPHLVPLKITLMAFGMVPMLLLAIERLAVLTMWLRLLPNARPQAFGCLNVRSKFPLPVVSPFLLASRLLRWI